MSVIAEPAAIAELEAVRIAEEEARSVEIAGAGRIDDVVDLERFHRDAAASGQDDRAFLAHGHRGKPAILRHQRQSLVEI